MEAHIAMNRTPLLALDPALPQRDLLLDETLMAEYLSRLVARYGDFGIQDCERLRTKYRVGASLRVLYEVSGNGQSYRIAARALPRTRRVADRLPSPVEVSAPELNTIFWIYPHDRKIKNLSVLANIPDDLRDIDGQTWIKSRIVAHAPEKSVTAQCIDDSDQIIAYAKIYAGDEGHQVIETYTHVAKALSAHDVQTPRVIAYHEQHHLLLLESVAGVSLSACAQRENAFFRLGKALKKFHGLNPPPAAQHATRLTPKALTQATNTISQARPDVADLVHRLSSKLIARYEHGKPVFLHGDVHPKNILLNDDQLFLLDLDQAATGPAEVDLGSVIAGLYCDACTGTRTWREASSLQRFLLTGYGIPENSHALRWHTAAALLQERALRSVTRVRAAALQKLPELLLTAEAALNGGIGEN
jgi:aminoglycoside/choline kinase family phosphotransferase